MSVAPAKTGDVWGRSPHLGVGWKCVSDASAVTEVHLRRLDVGSDLHRRVVAVLTVDATPQEVRRNRQEKRLCFGEKVVSGMCGLTWSVLLWVQHLLRPMKQEKGC